MAMWFLPRRNWARYVPSLVVEAKAGDLVLVHSAFAVECVKNFSGSVGKVLRVRLLMEAGIPARAPRDRAEGAEVVMWICGTDDRAHLGRLKMPES